MSSISASAGIVDKIPRRPLRTRDAKGVIPFSSKFPRVRLVIVSRDHAGFLGFPTAFFRESMRRDAISGMNVVFTLQINTAFSCIKIVLVPTKSDAHIAGKSWTFL